MVEELLSVDPSDSHPTFWKEMKHLFFAMWKSELENLDNETREGLLKVTDEVLSAYKGLKRKRGKRGGRHN